MFPRAVRLDEAHEERRKVPEDLNLALVRLHRFLPEIKRDLRRGVSFGQPRANFCTAFFSERRTHAAGHGPCGMNFFAAENLDDFLAELAEADSRAGEAGIRSDQAENVSLRWRCIPAEQKIRRAKMKETQCVALNDLAEVHQPAQLIGGGRDVHGHE